MKPNALQEIAAAAVASEKATGCPAELQAAQCILESGWLAHAPGQNPFGIKAARRHAKTQTLMTTEYVKGRRVRVPAKFAAYDSLSDAFIDHALLITTARAYARAWNQYQADRDLEALVRGIAPTYATDPAYADKLLSFMRREDLQRAIERARAPRTEIV